MWDTGRHEPRGRDGGDRGGAAVLVDPRYPASVAAGIEEAERRRDALAEIGRARASMFTWRRAADLVEDLWRELA